MNVQSIQASQQWAEIQRLANEKNIQRAQVSSLQIQSAYTDQSGPRSTETMNDELKRLRTVFTRNGSIEQNYIPKGVLFDKLG
jgi:hypothetical protein